MEKFTEFRGRKAKGYALAIAALSWAAPAFAGPGDEAAAAGPKVPPNVAMAAFVESLYAFDFNDPPNGDRSYATAPARNNEFNVNLAYVEAKAEDERMRGRLALQAGTSVQSNYAAEPRRGSVSGGDLSRHVQEARVGVPLDDRTWIDVGVFFSHLGAESFVSKDNLVLTRSLVADFSPYYLSGVKATRALSDRTTGQLMVVNGWQNVSENNSDKSVGASLEHRFSNVSVAWNTLAGSEVSPALNGTARGSEFRFFHDFIFRVRDLGRWEAVAQFDVGLQNKSGASARQWHGGALMARYRLSPERAIAMRAEAFSDPDQIVLVTGRSAAFIGAGGSLGYDQNLDSRVSWRSEVRFLRATEEVFPRGDGSWARDNWTLASALSLSI